MKKTILIIMIIAAIVLPLTAAAPTLNIQKAAKGQFGAGVNLGTNLGAAVKWDNKDWDLYANIGAGYIGSNGFHFQGEVGAEFPVYQFEIENQKFDVNVGGLIPVGVGSYGVDLGILATAGLSYDFKDIPLTMYARTGLGVVLLFSDPVKVNFGGSGAIGAIWLF
jgi:hypothetical protein